MDPVPTFYEFFCGGGMARAGLAPEWRCLFANDFDPRKGAAYQANWGGEALRIGDVASLRADDLPGSADLAWASFPCQDLSLAGAAAGLDGARSGAFWGFCAAMAALKAEGRAPKLIALENVVGVLTSKGGADFAAIAAALQRLGYRYGALTIDAAEFLPQSRPRVFVLALRRDHRAPAGLVGGSPPAHHASGALQRAFDRLPPAVAADWIWWRAPPPPRPNLRLADCLEEPPTLLPAGEEKVAGEARRMRGVASFAGRVRAALHPSPLPAEPVAKRASLDALCGERGRVRWHSPAQTAALVAALSSASRRDVALACEAGGRRVGALFRRTRPDGAGGTRVQAEARFDGLAGCLRTPAGGSSRQLLIEVEGRETRTRLMTPREAARLMGLPDSFILPERTTDALHLVGDGVAPPVVRFLSEHLLLPLLAANEAAPNEEAAPAGAAILA